MGQTTSKAAPKAADDPITGEEWGKLKTELATVPQDQNAESTILKKALELNVSMCVIMKLMPQNTQKYLTLTNGQYDALMKTIQELKSQNKLLPSSQQPQQPQQQTKPSQQAQPQAPKTGGAWSKKKSSSPKGKKAAAPKKKKANTGGGGAVRRN